MVSEKKGKMFAARLDDSLVEAIEREALSEKTTKSQLVRNIVSHYFHIVKPKHDYEKITMGRNMFLLCLEHLDEEGLKKFSELGISNALREQNVLGDRIGLQELIENGRMEDFYKEIMGIFENSYGLDGLGWLTSVDFEYLEEKKCVYMKMNHDLNEKFSNYLLWHFPEVIRRTSDMTWKVLDHAITDTKLEIYLQLVPNIK